MKKEIGPLAVMVFALAVMFSIAWIAHVAGWERAPIEVTTPAVQTQLEQLGALQDRASERLEEIARLKVELDERELELEVREAVLLLALKAYREVTGVGIQIRTADEDEDETTYQAPSSWPSEDTSEGPLYNLAPPQQEPPPAHLEEPLLREHVEPLDPPTPQPQLADPVPAEDVTT